MAITLNGTTGITTPAIQSWVSVSTSSAVYAGQHIMADTSAGAITLTLPTTPAANEAITFVDKFNTWDSNNLTIARNGNTINSLSENLICDIEGANITLIYNGTTWQIYA